MVLRMHKILTIILLLVVFKIDGATKIVSTIAELTANVQ
jgi:hypothetical protein